MTERQSLLLMLAIAASVAVGVIEFICTVFVPATLWFGLPLKTIRFSAPHGIASALTPGFVLTPVTAERFAFRETLARRTAGAKGTLTLDLKTHVVTLRAIIPWSLPFIWWFFAAAFQGAPIRVKVLILSVATMMMGGMLLWQVARCRVLIAMLCQPAP
jgi:hypothetical protein